MKRTKVKSRIYKKRTVRKDKKKLFPILRIVIILLVFGFTCIFFYVWLSYTVIRKRYYLSQRGAHREYVEKKSTQLKLEVSKLSSLERIERIGKNELKLIEAKEKDIIWINK